MGFMDKAKKMAEQAQAKLDEAQQQFNSGEQAGSAGERAVEYDAHGRPIAEAPSGSASPPHGDPVAGSRAEQPIAPVPPTPGVPPTGQGDPVMPAPPAAPPVAQPGVPPTQDEPAEDRNHPSYAPPKLSSGDPLAG